MSEMKVFIESTERVLEHIKALVVSEREKRQALLSHDMVKLESVVQTQQAMAMKLEGLEKKRYSSQCALGYKDFKSAQILERASAEDKAVLTPLFNEMYIATNELQELNKISIEIATDELNLIDQLMQQPSVGDIQNVYNKQNTRSNAHQTGSAFREKI